MAASACLAAAMSVNARRSCAVIRLPASIPASSASSWESCSRAWMMAISPVAWPSWPLSDSLFGLDQEQVLLIGDPLAVSGERVQGAQRPGLDPGAQQRELAQVAVDGLDRRGLGGCLAADRAGRGHRRLEHRLVGVGTGHRGLVGLQVGRRGPEQVGHRRRPLGLYVGAEPGGRDAGRVDQAGRPVQVDGVVDQGARDIGEQPDQGDQGNRHEKINPEPDGPAARSHATPWSPGVGMRGPPTRPTWGQGGQNSPYCSSAGGRRAISILIVPVRDQAVSCGAPDVGGPGRLLVRAGPAGAAPGPRATRRAAWPRSPRVSVRPPTLGTWPPSR